MKLSKHALDRSNFRQVFIELIAIIASVFVVTLAVKSLASLTTNLATLLMMAVAAGIVHTIIHAALWGYRTSWRFFSLRDAKYAAASAALAISTIAALFFSTLPIVGWILVFGTAIAAAISSRLLARIAHSRGLLGPHIEDGDSGDGDTRQSRQALLMIGYGDQVAHFIRSQEHSKSNYDITGVVHIGETCDSASLRGVSVLGSVGQLKTIIERLTASGRRPDFLVVTRDELSNRSVGDLLSMTDKVGVPVAWLPRSDRIDPSAGQQLRPIKLDDLLPRSATLFDARACAKLMGRSTVLVTGAGGSIGSELVRQIASLAPDNLVLTDVSEHALYMIDQEIRRRFPNVNLTALLLDVRDRDAVFRTVASHKPDFMFHAAALKHVPIVEAQACEGVLTNVVGSRNVADAAAKAGVSAMVMVSTDKAVNPANVMGATKRMAEAYCQAMDAAATDVKGATRYVTVRFGNVLGSNGSVVPLFQQQLARGGPLTVTHPDVERFFMTIPEASRLILQALLLGMDDSEGDQGIFVLDMGEPVKIVDLARQVIRLSGMAPERDVKIVYTGLRPGEKLYEELMHETENLLQTEHPSLMVAQPRFVQIQTVRSQIEVIRGAASSGDATEVMRLLKLYIPEFAMTAKEAESTKSSDIPRLARPEAM